MSIVNRKAISVVAVLLAFVATLGASLTLGTEKVDSSALLVVPAPPKTVRIEVPSTTISKAIPAPKRTSVPIRELPSTSTSTSPPTTVVPFVLDFGGVDFDSLLVAEEQKPVEPQKAVASVPKVQPPAPVVPSVEIDLRPPAGGAVAWSGSGDAADPFVLRRDGDYFAFSTNTSGANVPVWYSNDLKSWTLLIDALPELPAWAASTGSQTWAPSVLQRGGSFILYFTTRDAATNRQCIGVATSSEPQGPYVSSARRPLVCQASLGGSIDPSPFVDSSGTPWLLWKNDGNCCAVLTRIWSQQLSGDGLSVVGGETELLWADQEWEASLIEGPAMVSVNGTLHLFYSANGWSTNQYAIGHAVCETVQGPCYKSTTTTSWGSSDGGPGGAEFFSDAVGQVWMVFHEWRYRIGYPGGERSMYLRPMRFPRSGPLVTTLTTLAPVTSLAPETTLSPTTVLAPPTTIVPTTISPVTTTPATVPPTTTAAPKSILATTVPTTAVSTRTTRP
ncbi:MAG: glycoside hydrolase family 43 protein [Acidimicrobiales bacterium]